MDYTLLKGIKSPEDVKKLNSNEVKQLCEEARDIIIKTVSENGGHLASNLGAVELTVALHRSFNSPNDAIIFDVGHQSYTHKLLTGRFEQFSTLRKKDGISGFMRPSESEHDPFVTGHSSNSISA
ncbi:MAG: 1-deoxy-D-xylulose-5-phosphate synthase, partial [Clostridia bacterium]|nr:1-deoxy-D-xylulose-5-phosphate synthase [Clostridia bacterium]